MIFPGQLLSFVMLGSYRLFVTQRGLMRALGLPLRIPPPRLLHLKAGRRQRGRMGVFAKRRFGHQRTCKLYRKFRVERWGMGHFAGRAPHQGEPSRIRLRVRLCLSKT